MSRLAFESMCLSPIYPEGRLLKPSWRREKISRERGGVCVCLGFLWCSWGGGRPNYRWQRCYKCGGWCQGQDVSVLGHTISAASLSSSSFRLEGKFKTKTFPTLTKELRHFLFADFLWIAALLSVGRLWDMGILMFELDRSNESASNCRAHLPLAAVSTWVES